MSAKIIFMIINSVAEAAEAKNDLAARLHSIGYEIAEGRGDYKES